MTPPKNNNDNLVKVSSFPGFSYSTYFTATYFSLGYGQEDETILNVIHRKCGTLCGSYSLFRYITGSRSLTVSHKIIFSHFLKTAAKY